MPKQKTMQKAGWIIFFLSFFLLNQGNAYFSPAKRAGLPSHTSWLTCLKEKNDFLLKKGQCGQNIKFKYRKKRGKGIETSSIQFSHEIKHIGFYFAELSIPCLQSHYHTYNKTYYSDRAPPLKG